MNRNAHLGKNVESLFKNSIQDHLEIIERIQNEFGITSRLTGAINSGVHNEKVDVKLGFACGRNIDANIKAFKAGLNQLTRTTLTKFCKHFNLDCFDWLQSLVLEKAKHSIDRYNLFPLDQRQKAIIIFTPIVKDIVEWSMSFKKSREILVLYDRELSIMHIYSMKTILNKLKYDISFTSQGGNLLIGGLISIKRKGGDSNSCLHRLKTDPAHPSNNIQLQLKVRDFIKQMQQYELAQYSI